MSGLVKEKAQGLSALGQYPTVKHDTEIIESHEPIASNSSDDEKNYEAIKFSTACELALQHSKHPNSKDDAKTELYSVVVHLRKHHYTDGEFVCRVLEYINSSWSENSQVDSSEMRKMVSVIPLTTSSPALELNVDLQVEQTEQKQHESVDTSRIDPRNPYAVAQLFALGFTDNQGRLLFHHGSWLSYFCTHYIEMDTATLRARLYRWLNVRRRLDGTEVAASPHLVNNVLDALKSAVHVEGNELPRWLGTETHPDPRNLIVFRNGLLDVEAWLADPATRLLPHSSDWLSTMVLPFDFVEQAACPHWEKFIAEIANGDETWIAGLAMMFGYLLTHDASQQKIFILQGAPRAGKGTICRVLREMLGHANVACPSLPNLCGDFGLWPLVGKSVALIPDAHLGRNSDVTRVLEVLKSISGEDAVDVNRKHRDQQTMRLPVRFVLACNTLLDLPDPSGALASRLILFPFTHSYVGKEDTGLEGRLLTELPGILRWSLAGLRALRETGRLIQPKSGEQVRADFARLSSPIRGFIDEELKVNPAGLIPVAEAYQAWKLWCEREGHHPGATSSFGAKLLAAVPGISKARLGTREHREWCYKGICLPRNGDVLGHARTQAGQA